MNRKQCQSLYYGETVMKIEKRFPEPFSDPRWWWSGYGLVPQCFDCKHFKGLIQNQKRCSAFRMAFQMKFLIILFSIINHIRVTTESGLKNIFLHLKNNIDITVPPYF